MNNIQVGDWVRLVNLEDEDLNEETTHELGALYRVLDVEQNNRTVVVDGIYNQEWGANEPWWIYTSCFQKENEFLVRFKEKLDEHDKTTQGD